MKKSRLNKKTLAFLLAALISMNIFGGAFAEENLPIELDRLFIEGTSIAGTEHIINADVSSSKKLLYKFSVRDLSTGKWTVIQDYGEKDRAAWIPKQKGSYWYGVDIKEYGSQKDSEISKHVPIEIKPSIPAELHSLDMTGTNEAKTQHIITAKGTGVNGVLYRFHIKDEGTGKWTKIQDYSEKNTANWMPEKSGNYKYAVHAKDKNSFEDMEVEMSKNISISDLKPAIAESLDIKGSLFEKTNHTITAKGRSTNGVLYRFHIKDESTGKWIVIQDYSEKDSVTWRPGKIGKYTYYVAIKDKNSDKDKDASLSNMVTINPPVYYNVTNYNETLDKALDKQVGRNTIYKDKKWEKATKEEIKTYMDPSRFLQFEPNGNGEDRPLIAVEVVVSALNVRKDPNTSSSALATVSSGSVYIVLEEKDGWFKINANGKIGWVSADHVRYVNDVPREMYQFMVLSGQAGATAAQMNKELIGKGILEGQGAAFITASKKYNINELYLMAHSLLETGNGTSTLAKGVLVDKVDGKAVEPRVTYNMYGIGAIDSDPLRGGSERAYKEGWFTPEIAIIEGAHWISNNYINSPIYKQDTLYKMKWNIEVTWHQYATDVAWAFKQIKQIDNMMEYCRRMEGIVLKFDIPKFK